MMQRKSFGKKLITTVEQNTHLMIQKLLSAGYKLYDYLQNCVLMICGNCVDFRLPLMSTIIAVKLLIFLWNKNKQSIAVPAFPYCP